MRGTARVRAELPITVAVGAGRVGLGLDVTLRSGAG